VLAVLAAAAPFPLTWPTAPAGGGRLLLAGPAVPGGRGIAFAGLLLAIAVVLRTAGCVAGEVRRGWRDRRDHADLVAATGHPGDEPGVAIVDYVAPAVYCLPGGRQQVVISAGALAALSREQLRAVLAHERAHLRARHHLILALAAALARAFPRVPLLSQARPQLAVLAEMAADDAAARRYRRDDLASALVVLARARAGAQPATLAASGPEAIARLQRILDLQPSRTGLAKLAAVAGLIPAVAIACLPLLLAACDASGHP
jgi:Zn-dependent protease with chaperone function